MRPLASAAAVMIAAASWASLTVGAYAEDTKATDAFAQRLFAGKIGKEKSYGCFARRYDSEHLARHPLQKVSTMKLLITAEKMPEDDQLNYSFRLGVDFRHRHGDFDSSGDCGHVKASETPQGEIALNCSVDCDGGGIKVELKPDNQAVTVHLDSIRIWRANAPDEEASHSLEGGDDDRVFRLDRTGTDDCASLVTDRKELAAMRHK